MKLLYILENYHPHVGGVEVVFKNLCEGMAKRGNDVSVVTHHLAGTPKHEVVNGVKIWRVPSLGSRYVFSFTGIPRSIREAFRCDIVHTTTFNAVLPAWISSLISRKPRVITVHEIWIGKWKEYTGFSTGKARFHDFLERMIYLLPFDAYVSVSGSTRKQLLKVIKDKKKVHVVHNAIDYMQWNPGRYDRKKRAELGLEKDFVAVFTGRPGHTKGFEYLLKAVPLIKIDNFKLLAIVSQDKGYKERYELMQKIIKDLKIGDRVILHPAVRYDEVPYFIKAADCVVVPSLAEGFGYSVAEANAMGVPVVASDTTSIPEVISGKHVLVRPRDPKSIAKGIMDIYRKKYKNTPLKSFSIDDNLGGYKKIYEGLL